MINIAQKSNKANDKQKKQRTPPPIDYTIDNNNNMNEDNKCIINSVRRLNIIRKHNKK